MFYVVMATVAPGITINDVQALLSGLSVSFYRLAPNVWILYTYSSARAISDVLQPLCNPGGQLFVSRLDLQDRWGWMNQQVWNWINQHGGPG